MIRPQYVVVAEFQREGQLGKYDLLGVFDRIFTPAVPGQHNHLVFVVQLVTDDEPDLGKRALRFSVVTPDGKTLLEQRGEIDFKPGGGTWLASARVAFQINGMPLPEFGKYRFLLELNGKQVASHTVSVATVPANLLKK